MQRAFRMFTVDADDGGWIELTGGTGPAARIAAADLQRAQRRRNRIRAVRDVAVVLDVTVSIAENFRAARRGLAGPSGTAADSVRYAGTVAGLAGLLRDIFVAEVADGVTLLPAVPGQDLRPLASAALAASGLEFAGHPALDLGDRHCG